MIQFYLLSVVLSAASGLLLVFSKQVPEDAAEASAAGLSFFETKNFRLVLGLLTALTGIMKFLSVVQGDIPVIGDLIPAVAGISAGVCLLYEYYKASASVSFSLPPFLLALLPRKTPVSLIQQNARRDGYVQTVDFSARRNGYDRITLF